ncbi:hypothetical protein D3C80_1667430 [compost metagenome]
MLAADAGVNADIAVGALEQGDGLGQGMVGQQGVGLLLEGGGLHAGVHGITHSVSGVS